MTIGTVGPFGSTKNDPSLDLKSTEVVIIKNEGVVVTQTGCQKMKLTEYCSPENGLCGKSGGIAQDYYHLMPEEQVGKQPLCRERET